MIIGVLAIGSSLMFFSYLLALTIEIVIKLKNATTVSYSKRNIFYHVFAISITISFCLLGILRNEFGESKMHTCSLIDNRVTRTVYSSYVMASIFAIWGLLIYIWKKIKESSSGIVFSYSLVVMSVTTTITISTLMDILKSYTNGESKQYNAVGVIFGSLTGTCIALARLSNRNLLKKLKVRLFVSRARQLTDTMLSLLNPEESISVEATFFGEFFDSITKKVGIYLDFISDFSDDAYQVSLRRLRNK